MIITADHWGEVPPRLRVCSVDGAAAAALIERRATEVDRQAAANHRRETRARQTLVGRALIRRLLADATGISGAEWRIVTDAEGRPGAVAANGRGGPDISIAHSGRWVACGLAERGRIGIDIEVERKQRDVQAIAKSVFSPAEQKAVAVDGQAAFLAFWTMREAIAKALGGGLGAALAMDGNALPQARDRSAVVVLAGRRWLLAQRGRPGFSVALAWFPEAGHGAAVTSS